RTPGAPCRSRRGSGRSGPTSASCIRSRSSIGRTRRRSPHGRERSMRDRRILICAAVAGLLIAQAPAARAAKTPALAYTGGNDRAATATLLQRFSKVGPFVSLSGGVLAAARPGAGGTSDVLGFDAATGAERFTIDDA